jgi:hypothetical protein
MVLSKLNRSLQADTIPRLIFPAGLIIGIGFFIYYYMHGLTVAHYDAKAHLLVARRMFDSLEPGYGQMGVNWLPLTHLVYLPFVFFDAQYRSGFLPSLISVFSFAFSGWLTYRITYRVTGSVPSGVFAALILFANPNFAYLQSCPLTEPLYIMLLLLALDRLTVWRRSETANQPWMAAVWLVLGALCRYEGWYVFSGVLLLLVYDFWTQFMPRRRVLQAAAVFLAVFAVPAAAHFGYIYFRLGDSFFNRVAGGNSSPYLTYKRPILSVVYHLGELSQMTALLPLLFAAAGLLVVLYQRKQFSSRVPLFLLWFPSLINISALYWGMIYRLRYSVILLPAAAIFGSIVLTSTVAKKRAFLLIVLVAMVLPWLSWYFVKTDPGGRLVAGPGAFLLPAAGLIFYMIARVRQQHEWLLPAFLILSIHVPLLDREARPMIVETMEHEFIEPERQEVMQYILRNYDNSRILIDMAKQAPLVYDLGLNVREFVYNEGGETVWHEALKNPSKHVGWMCSEQGDAIWERLQVDPGWVREYALALKTEHFSIYRLKS